MTSSPTMISAGTEMMPSIVPQSYFSPSWMPNTSRNMPTALSATPTQSKLCEWVGERGHEAPGQDESDDADRDVDEEDPLPAEGVDQDAAEDRTDERGDTGGRSPERHGAAAVGGRERAGDDRHGLRRHQRGADTLYDAGDDEHLDAAGQAAPQRREREDREPDQVDVLGAEPVTEPTGHEQRHGVGEQVGAGHPDDGVDVGLELASDRRRRDRHDRVVDEDHEEADDHGPQCRPGLVVGGQVGRCAHARHSRTRATTVGAARSRAGRRTCRRRAARPASACRSG